MKLDREDHAEECTKQYPAKGKKKDLQGHIAHFSESEDPTVKTTVDFIKSRALYTNHTKHHSALRVFKWLLDKPSAIFITDPSLSGLHIVLGRALVDYARAGGRVIYGGSFSSVAQYEEVDHLFEHVWNLPWRFCAYTSSEFRLHKHHSALRNYRPIAGLVDKVYSKANFVNNVAPEHTLYREVVTDQERARLKRDGELTGREPDGVKLQRAPVAMTRVGDGWVGFMGLVAGDSVCDKITLAMLGVMSKPGGPTFGT